MTHPLPLPREADATTDQVVASIRERIEVLGLDLRGLTILTEAATGYYAVTATIAAAAGATVYAFGRDTRRYGTFADAAAATLGLAARAGVAERIHPVRVIDPRLLNTCDIVTNSGHLRPIERATIGELPRHAVIAMMFEAWEFRGGDFDTAACVEHGIRIAAVNERHPKVGVFPFLGPLAGQLVDSGGVAIAGAKIAVLCDNPFAPFITGWLQRHGAEATTFASLDAIPAERWDVVVLSLTPFSNEPLGAADRARLDVLAPDALLAQFWGDMDRTAFAGVRRIVPAAAPAKGHMAVLLSDLGPEPVVRLQAGGLRAAELILRGEPAADAEIAQEYHPNR